MAQSETGRQTDVAAFGNDRFSFFYVTIRKEKLATLCLRSKPPGGGQAVPSGLTLKSWFLLSVMALLLCVKLRKT